MVFLSKSKKRAKNNPKKAVRRKPAGKKKIRPAQGLTRVRKASSGRPLSRRTGPAENKQQAIRAQEVVIEQAKYSHPQADFQQRQSVEELPFSYGEDKIVLAVRDTRWIHAYWEAGEGILNRLKSELKEEFYKAKRILRVYDVSNIIFNGNNAHRHFDIEISKDSNSWYIDTNGPGRSWCVDLGLLLSSGRFITIVRSNVVHTPLDGPSWITDEEWMIPEDMFARLYGMGFGLGKSSPVGRAWQERVRHALGSAGITSSGSPVKKNLKKGFWLKLDCELIVFGATEPDAKVTVQGKPISLRRDGTFTLRFQLPDGRQTIAVKAVSADKIEERSITPIVSRETK